ncbi:MAG: DUF2914 domain-containing protein [Patescibacteria group bacterium]
MKDTISNWHNFFQNYSRFIPVGALIFGFIFDLFTLGRPDSLYTNTILLIYLIVSAVCITILATARRKGKEHSIPVIALMQFSFGNLAGSLLVLYGMSGTFAGSAIFFGIISLFLVGNEFIRERYSQVLFHLLAWYFLSLLYFVFALPVFLAQIGSLVFLESVLLSGIVFGLFIFLLLSISRESLHVGLKTVGGGAATVALIFSGLYFGNFIPPVPLSLQKIGIYHSISRVGGGYRVEFEAPRWYEYPKSTSRKFHVASGGIAICFSSVFATDNLKTPLWHLWEKYDEGEKKWKLMSTYSFPISGGRDEGFRWYSQKSSVTPGDWRCSVETESGALIGRTKFEVVSGGEVVLKEGTL